MDAGKLKHKVEVWGKKGGSTNSLGKNTKEDKKIKDLWCDFIPQTNSMQNRPAETILVRCTHKVVCRFNSAKMIKNDMYLKYRGRRFDVKYVSDPYMSNTRMDIWVEEVIE
ncbi:hypothetical protein J40TS1_34100 [Paenibacillus montaniterrae]|uniref:Head-tail adaptor protein n=1 Tax=Paenibacillus montaniterrae TaxID=429341 RepID=A0A920CZS1_9BACL|nr:phage head closure protein [Paenibacillus montaniterrae]GIP17768.1 hypothetical protein J40TS1_34100 [Paenibacillus montaniterrae]